MTDQEKEVMNIVKSRLGIEDDLQDDVIATYIIEAGYRIKHYCQRSDIPKALNFVWASMVIDALRVDQSGDFGGDDGDIYGMNIKIGDTSISPASGGNNVTATNKASIEKIVLNYMADLHRYRKLKW